ncbi:alpha/beta hydrolase-fold protein [Nocardioides lijunqiniae]|uniref:alpha/beta hydrolase-fold protein n=1 Tax=Nocardioides lijunqiniae TaxID=2760832 RepID=UPI001878B3A3
MLSRRGVLLGAAAVTTVGVAGTAGVVEGVLPGRPALQAALGLNGEPGRVPDIAPGPVETGSFVSERRGARTGWVLLRPPGAEGARLPVVVALHGLGWRLDAFQPGGVGIPQFLAAAVADGVPPFVVVAPEGGRSYWHPRPDGEDAGAMVTDELLPLLGRRDDLDVARIGLLGWSMGGYGALRLAGLLGPGRAPVVAVGSPALWSDASSASRSGFEDEAEYREFTVTGRQEDLAGTAVRIDCGTGDPFYRDVEDYVDGFPSDAEVTATFEPGAHDRAYWRRVLPDQLAFLGSRL